MPSHETTGSPWDLVRQLAAMQDGLVTRAQWSAVGLDNTQVRRMVSAGRWQRLLRGVFLVYSGLATLRQRQRAALLYAGDHAQLTGTTALALYGLRYVPRDTVVHVLLPASSGKRGQGFVRIHRTRTPPPSRQRDGLECAPLEQAAVLACRDSLSLQTARALMSEVVQRRLTTVERLDAALAAGPSAGSALPRRVLGDLAAGCRSAPECELRDVLRSVHHLRAGLVLNHRIVVGGRPYIADACWPHLKLIIEVDSIEHHGLGDGPEYTSRRRAALTADGWTVLSVSPRRLRQDARAFLADVTATHRRLATVRP